ncbi:MAG: PepSY domain-containing protein [Kineosporiaceae bacterium]
MTRSTVISGIVAGLAVVGVTAGVAAAVNGGSGDERVETISVSPVDAPDPTATATPTGSATTSGPSPTTPVQVPAGITSDEAVRIALAAVAGTLDGVELEVEDGRTVWDVDVHGADGWEYEVDVDARTGEIVERERDDRVDDHGGDDSDDHGSDG